MPRYLLPCSCGQSIVIDTIQAGQEVRCSCGQSQLVPTLREIRQLPEAEIYASSNDMSAKNHCRLAELCIERAKRLVEAGQDVFLLLILMEKILVMLLIQIKLT